MLAFKFLEKEVSCPLSNMPLTGAMLSLKNQAHSSALSSNLRQSLASDILHESVQCQNILSSALPLVKQKYPLHSLLSSLTHQSNNIRQKAQSLTLQILLLFPQFVIPSLISRNTFLTAVILKRTHLVSEVLSRIHT